MEQPLVSVVLPIYNVEKYLNRCVESVISQTYQNLEIIMVDDGSPDNCPTLCDEWAKKDNRIRVIHKQNAGLGMARNTGIENATGKYIFFWDTDDYVDCTIVEKCVKNALKNQSDVVIYGFTDVWDDGRTRPQPMKLSQLVYKGDEILYNLLPGMYIYNMGFGISAWGKMFRLSAFFDANVRFKSEREIISEDAYFALELYSQIHTVSIINESLYFYYKRSDSLSRAYKKDRQEKNDYFIEQALAYVEQEGLPNCVKQHVIARYHMYTVAGIRQLMGKEMSKKEKKDILNSILRSKTLTKTISMQSLKLHKKLVSILLMFIKLKWYPVCRLLVWLRR